MAAGLTAQLSLTQLNTQAGGILLSLVRDLDQVADMQAYLATQGTAGLQALGMTADDATTLLSAFSDAAQLVQLWHGQAALASAKDFTVFVQRCIGTGVH
jgi:hypothetical protein